MDFSRGELVVTLILATLVVWFIYRGVRISSANRKYQCSISGGRPGSLSVVLDDAKVSGETDVGTSVDVIIYQSSLRWQNGTMLDSEEIERVARRLESWSEASGISYVLADDT